MAAAVEKIEKEPDPTDLDLKAWYSAMGGGGADIEVVVSRVQPPHWKLPNGRVVPIAGKIPGALYTEMIDEEFIEQTFGGGLYKLGIKKRHADGRMQFWKQKTVKVGGDPIIDPSMLASNAYQPDDGHAAAATAAAVAARPEPQGESPTLAMHALDTMKEVVDDLRGERGRGGGNGFDHALFEALSKPLTMQLEQFQKAQVELQKALAEKDARIYELLSRRPDTSTQDTLIGKMWDSESGRIEAIRTQHDSERNALRASHEAREKSLAQQHERDLKNKDDDHKRLLDTLQRAHDDAIKGLERMHAVEVKMLENRIADLTRDLGKAEAKVGALETIKQQSFSDKVKEIKEFKELVSDGDDDKDDDKPPGLWGAIQSVVDGVIENPEVLGTILGARGGPPPQQVPQEQRVARLPDGRMVRVTPRPVVQAAPVPQVVAPAQPALPALEGAAPPASPAPPAPPASPPVRKPSPADLALAVTYLENASKSGQEPEVVAASVRTLVPADVLAYLEKVGVDELLNSVTTLDQGSPLRSVQGRNFVRKVAKTLLTGSPE